MLSTAALIVATSALAYCKSIAAFFVDLYGGGFGDWDPERAKQVRHSCACVGCVSLIHRSLGNEWRHRDRGRCVLSPRFCFERFAGVSAQSFVGRHSA